MNNSLTISEETIRIPLVGQTEVGSAEVQPTRDSQLKATNCRWDGSYTPAVPFYQESKTIQSFLMPKKTSLSKARLLVVKYNLYFSCHFLFFFNLLHRPGLFEL